jgi:sugar phosphate isomerase/epimerase
MISYQLYSSRNFPPLGDTLTMVSGLGYDAVEGYGALYADDALVADLTARLGASGLKMPSGHFGLAQLEAEPEKVIAIARALGISRIYCPNGDHRNDH